MFENLYSGGTQFLGATFDSWPMQFVFVLAQAILIIASFILLVGVVWVLVRSKYYKPKIQKWQWFFEKDAESFCSPL